MASKKKEPKKIDESEFNNDIIEEIKKEPDQHISVPKTLLKKEEWGLLTALNLSLALLFPAYFVNILLISFFTEVGHLWTTHLTEKERQRLLQFEKEFREGHEYEKAGKWKNAIKVYKELPLKYEDNPKIAEIAIKRIAWIKKKHLKKGK